MRTWLIATGTTLALALVACSGGGAAEGTSESNVTQERAFEYTCTTPASMVLEDAASMKVAISASHLRFADGFGINFGSRDSSYRPPQGRQRVRYEGFEYGGDCGLRLVMDEGALTGQPNVQLRVQCSGDDFFQDLYSCNDPQPTNLSFPSRAPEVPETPAGPPANAQRWTCATDHNTVLSDSITMQVSGEDMRILDEESEHLGARDPNYRSQSGAYMEFEGFEYGGDCSMSAIVEQKVLTAGTREVTLKVRCAGEDFTQDIYRCAPN